MLLQPNGLAPERPETCFACADRGLQGNADTGSDRPVEPDAHQTGSDALRSRGLTPVTREQNVAQTKRNARYLGPLDWAYVEHVAAGVVVAAEFDAGIERGDLACSAPGQR